MRRMAAIGVPAPVSAVAIFRADGRSDTVPTAKRRPEPIVDPISIVMIRASTVICVAARMVSE